MSVKIFFCYAHEDEPLLNKLKGHLLPLQRQGLIDVWHDRNIAPGSEWEEEIRRHLNEAEIILLLISPDFMNSDYCYGIEMKRAIDRHSRGVARVIPIILRPTYWEVEPLSGLQALPRDAKPVISPFWHSQDEAFLNIAEGIRQLVPIAKRSLGFISYRNDKEVIRNFVQIDEPLPVSLTFMFSLVEDNQRQASIHLMENSERLKVVDDIFKGTTFDEAIIDLPPKLSQGAKFEVTFELNRHGLLYITGRVPLTNTVSKAIFKSTKSIYKSIWTT
jgi:hypothetical protein